MIETPDRKLSQQVKVVLHRIPKVETSSVINYVKSNQCQKMFNFQDLKKFKKEINNQDRKFSSSCKFKKEKKEFEVVNGIEVSKLANQNYYLNQVKCEKTILDPIKSEKETKKHLKRLFESNIVGKALSVKKALYNNKNLERKVQIKNEVEPLIELVPTLIKTEKPDVIAVKKIQRKNPNVVEINEGTAEVSALTNPSKLISQNALTTICICNDYSKTLKSESGSSKDNLNLQSKFPVNKGAVRSSRQTLGSPHAFVEKKNSSVRSTGEFEHQIKPKHSIIEEESSSEGSYEFSPQTLKRTDILLQEAPQNLETVEIRSKTLEKPWFEVSTNQKVVGNSHQTSTKDKVGSETLARDRRDIPGRQNDEFMEEFPSNRGISEFSHETLDKQENNCLVTSKRTEISFLKIGSTNKSTVKPNHNTLTRLGEDAGSEVSNNGSAADYIEQTTDRLRDKSCAKASTAGPINQTQKKPSDQGPLEVAQKPDVQYEPTQAVVNTSPGSNKNSTIKSGVTSKNVIKVKAPQVLGIKSQDGPENGQSMFLENRLNFSHLSQIRSTSGNESRISEICRVYPIFFTSEAINDISTLIQILHQTSREYTLEQIKNKQYNESYLLNIQKGSKTLVETFNNVLKIDQIGSDKDLLKKIIPILYLHLDKAFKRLRPMEDFDFRVIMKQMFEAASFVCDHDVILDKSYEMFQKVMVTLDRWLEDIFIQCDVKTLLSASSQPVVETSNIEKDSLEDTSKKLEDDDIQLIDLTDNTNTLDSDICNADIELDYLHCPVCRESIPLCCICKELLCCPCLLQQHQTETFHRGPKSLNFCIEHAECGDNWTEWLEGWEEEGRESHDMPLNPICWNDSCNNTAKWLCICRSQAYCSEACQVEAWNADHHKSCRMESDPNFYLIPRDVMDTS